MRQLQHDDRLALRAPARCSPAPCCVAPAQLSSSPAHLAAPSPRHLAPQEHAHEPSQRYKEGKYIVEKAQLFKARRGAA